MFVKGEEPSGMWTQLWDILQLYVSRNFTSLSQETCLASGKEPLSREERLEDKKVLPWLAKTAGSNSHILAH